MKLVTVATHSEGYFPWLLKSCKRFGAQLTVLGMGEKWQGFTWRFHLMVQYLKELNADEIVCFIDGYDVVLLKSLEELERRYVKIHEKTHCKIAVAYEQITNTFHKVATNYTFGTCQQQNVNAGTYIGYAGDLLDVLQSIYAANPSFNSDDQELLIKYCKQNPNNFYIDSECKLFYTLVNPLGHKHEKDDNIYNSCILHAPGATDITEYLKELGYEFSEEEEAKLNEFHKKSHKQKVFYYMNLFKTYYLLVLLVVVIMIATLYKVIIWNLRKN